MEGKSVAIFVTGASGYIGNILAQKLTKNGEEVHVLVRQASDLSALHHEKIKLCPGDITDRESLKTAMSGCSRVYHLAAYARGWSKDPSAYYQVNVEGLRNVLDCAWQLGVEKVVFTSSSVSLGASENDVCCETMPRRSLNYYTEYERSKCQAEEEALRFAQKGLSVALANPTRVYGPGKLTEANTVTKMIKVYLENRFCLILNKGQEIGNYVYIDDVVSGLCLIMDKGRPGERYILGGENTSLADFYELLEKVTHKKALRVYLPKKVAMSISQFEEWKARHFSIYPIATREWIENFLHNWAFSSRKAIDELGYAPRSLEEGFCLTCAWLGHPPEESRAQ